MTFGAILFGLSLAVHADPTCRDRIANTKIRGTSAQAQAVYSCHIIHQDNNPWLYMNTPFYGQTIVPDIPSDEQARKYANNLSKHVCVGLNNEEVLTLEDANSTTLGGTLSGPLENLRLENKNGFLSQRPTASLQEEISDCGYTTCRVYRDALVSHFLARVGERSRLVLIDDDQLKLSLGNKTLIDLNRVSLIYHHDTLLNIERQATQITKLNDVDSINVSASDKINRNDLLGDAFSIPVANIINTIQLRKSTRGYGMMLLVGMKVERKKVPPIYSVPNKTEVLIYSCEAEL